VEASGDRDAIERFFLFESLPDALKHGHLPIRPLDPKATLLGKP
jgi:hypothetical protein